MVDPADQYVTLSHRWRKVQTPQLTAENENQFREGRPISELCKTFQDAAVVARHLGIHLLWIDCLCIIQQGDDDRDWAVEAGRMDVIYQNAYCNFSADNATNEDDDIDQGLFFDRDVRLHAQLQLQSATTDGDGNGVGEENWTSISKGLWRTEVNKSPLNTRGWVFQERALAPRVIHFCRREIFWECRDAFLCESSPTTAPHPSVFDVGNFLPLRQRPTELWENSGWFGDSNFPVEDVPYEVWDDVVKEYTRRQFTFPNDKLVAISGMARSLKGYIDDTYLAGMWRKRLAAELGWWVYQGRAHYTLGEEPSYYAPSFSWASVKGQVNSSGPFALGILVGVECVTLESGPQNPSGDEIFCEDVFGVPLRAPVFQLRVSGVLRPAKLRWADRWELDVTAASKGNTTVVLLPLFDFVVPPERRAEFESETIYMMDWRYGPESGDYNMSKSDLYCMILMPTDRARHQFRRAGFVFTKDDQGRLLHESRVEDVLPECLDKETGKHTVYLV